MTVNLDGFRRRSVLAIGGGVATCLAVPSAWSASSALPYPKSLADELARALKAGQPLVVMVSLEGCPFCRVARDSYLAPMVRQEGVPVVQIDMRTLTPVRDFQQATVTHDEMARAWGIKVAPTVLFFGPGGKEVAARLVGGYIPDFYGAYLDERMQTARAAIKP
jgi:thioredoxin-related protein